MKLSINIRKNEKGFTLIEMLAVLTIMAILAAVSIPSMMGFVNDAKRKSYLSEARVAMVAAQAYWSEHSDNSKAVIADMEGRLGSEECALTPLMEGSYTEGAVISDIIYEEYQINGLTYTLEREGKDSVKIVLSPEGSFVE